MAANTASFETANYLVSHVPLFHGPGAEWVSLRLLEGLW